jgi:hypothetical protein
MDNASNTKMDKKSSVKEAKVLLCAHCEAEDPTYRILERSHGPACYDERFYCDKDCARARQRERSVGEVKQEMVYLKKMAKRFQKGTFIHEAIVASFLTYDAMLKRNTDMFLRFKAKAEVEWNEVLSTAKDDKSCLIVAKEMKRWADMGLCAQAYVDIPVREVEQEQEEEQELIVEFKLAL